MRLFDDRASAPDRSCRTVKRGKEAIARVSNLTASEAQQLPSNERVVALEQVKPTPVAELDGSRRRFDDVGEKNCRQHPVGSRILPPTCLRDLLEKLLDLILDPGASCPQSQVSHPGDLDKAR